MIWQKKIIDFFNGNLEVISDMAADTTGNKLRLYKELISYVLKLLNFHLNI